MSPSTKLFRLSLLALGASALFVGCTAQPQPEAPAPPTEETAPAPNPEPVQTQEPSQAEPDPDGKAVESPDPDTPVSSGEAEEEPELVAHPGSITVLVNKQHALPEDYVPTDLVEPDVRFIFEEKHERRLMRAEAATALEELFAAAEEDGIYLAGVSGYRSYAYQDSLFTAYVSTDGLELAQRYSARPGQSEHQTGLAMDISGSTGECAADDCFAGTPEAEWLAAHAHEHGFILRYPEGKEPITGYMYEPWHVRYLGEELAQKVYDSGLTYEEYVEQNR